MTVRLSKEQKIRVINSEDVYKIMQQVLLRENKIRRAQEHFWIVGLDNKNKILFIELIALGAQNRLDAAPPDIFRMAIYKLATKVIFVHNHPSGDVNPGRSDKKTTERLIEAGELLNISVVDHLIISETKYVSFLDKKVIKFPPN
ncbi:MAG TPA: JAB domain-containing protein [Chitinophagaceae bacterium]|nr:JAB domain-containing protein [Chitinophagaceae bacterium]